MTSLYKQWLAMWRDIGQAVFFHHVSGYNLVKEARVALRARTKHSPGEGTDGWCTPLWLTDLLGPFDLDPCSNERSTVRATTAFNKAADGLAQYWNFSSVFCNPPYSDVLPWACRLSDHHGPWCALVKHDESTEWWDVLTSTGAKAVPFRKRLKFSSGNDGDTTANFPSVLVYKGWEPPVALQPYLRMPK